MELECRLVGFIAVGEDRALNAIKQARGHGGAAALVVFKQDDFPSRRSGAADPHVMRTVNAFIALYDLHRCFHRYGPVAALRSGRAAGS